LCVLVAKVLYEVIRRGGATTFTDRQFAAALQQKQMPSDNQGAGMSRQLETSSKKKPFLILNNLRTASMEIIKDPGVVSACSILEEFGVCRLQFLLELNQICKVEFRPGVKPKSGKREFRLFFIEHIRFIFFLLLCERHNKRVI